MQVDVTGGGNFYLRELQSSVGAAAAMHRGQGFANSQRDGDGGSWIQHNRLAHDVVEPMSTHGLRTRVQGLSSSDSVRGRWAGVDGIAR